MKRLRPVYWLAAAVILVLALVAGLMDRALSRFGSASQEGMPVEPKVNNEENSFVDLWFAGDAIFDLSVDRNINGILFSSANNTVRLLDRDRRLRWEKSFTSEPLQAKLSSCGGYLAVGTAGGTLFYMSADQRLWWEAQEAEPFYLLAISDNGRYVAAGRGSEEENNFSLDLYDQNGTLRWSMETGRLEKIYFSGETGQDLLFYSYRQDESVVAGAVSLEGEPLWSEEGVSLAALSRLNNRVAALRGDELLIYDYEGEPVWETRAPFSIAKVLFNPINGNVLIYCNSEGSKENLYYYTAGGELLWIKRIADGSLYTFTADGRYIITSSWRHYKEDYSQMVLLDESGNEINRWEVAMRVEYMVVTGNRRHIVLAGEDGYIDILDLSEFLTSEDTISLQGTYYSPVLWEKPSDTNLVTIYFIGEQGLLVPVSRPVSVTANRVRAAVEELIRGPARDSNLYRSFPKDALVNLLFVEEEGELAIDLLPEAAAMAGTAQTQQALNSLRYTMGCYPEVHEIYLTVEDQLIEIFGDGMILEQPVTPRYWKQPVFLPMLAGGRYYLVPREAGDLGFEQRDINGMLAALIQRLRNLYFVPGDLKLLGLELTDGTLKIDLSESLRNLFPESGGEEEKMQAALFLDAIKLTAFKNSDVKKVELLIEGEAWSLPEGYPSLTQSLSGTFYINPEP